MSRRPEPALAAIGSLLVIVLLALPRTAAAEEEVLTYRWSLGGIKGLLARVLVPGAGEAQLRTSGNVTGELTSELHITSPDSRRGEFWRYGARIEDPECGRVLEAWTEQFFRERAKETREELEEPGIFDIPSFICRLRRQPPTDPQETRIWSEGRVYPVRVEIGARSVRRHAGRPVVTRTYTVEGLKREDERFWQGRLQVTLAQDAVSTPLEILMLQPGLKIRLLLEEGGRIGAGEGS